MLRSIRPGNAASRGCLYLCLLAAESVITEKIVGKGIPVELCRLFAMCHGGAHADYWMSLPHDEMESNVKTAPCHPPLPPPQPTSPLPTGGGQVRTWGPVVARRTSTGLICSSTRL